MPSVTEQLRELADLARDGYITQEEYEHQKQAVLAQSYGGTGPGARGASSAPIPTSIGRYDIHRLLGEGGMGSVYVGRNKSPAMAEREGGDVAIKVIRPELARNQEFRQRFESEAELGLTLEHPGIIKALSLIEDGGTLALVSELVVGNDLDQELKKLGAPMLWGRAVQLFVQMLDAVEYAHERGVIHRDIKPENAIVTADDQIKILDFGIAKERGMKRTRTGTDMGTLHYMAPEQFRDAKSVTPAADIYALGMTFYEMLAGTLPWADDAAPYDVMKDKVEGRIPAVIEYNSSIPPALSLVVQRTIESELNQRHANAAAVRQHLLQAIPSLAQVTGETEATDIEVAPTPPGSVPAADTVVGNPTRIEPRSIGAVPIAPRPPATTPAAAPEVEPTPSRPTVSSPPPVPRPPQESPARTPGVSESPPRGGGPAVGLAVFAIVVVGGLAIIIVVVVVLALVDSTESPEPQSRTVETRTWEQETEAPTPRPVTTSRKTNTTPSSTTTTSSYSSYLSSHGVTMKAISTGSFYMGSRTSEADREADETRHRVTLKRAYRIADREVTQALFEAVMGYNPSTSRENGMYLLNDNYPVQNITWYDAINFCNKLSEVTGVTPAYGVYGNSVSWDTNASGFRLPTEAEWEYAARADTSATFVGTSSASSACQYGNVGDLTVVKDSTRDTIFPCDDGIAGLARVASYRANAWNLYDMMGNVWEFVWDSYAPYSSSGVTDPTGPSGSATKVIRGGSRGTTKNSGRVANRWDVPANERKPYRGFRIAMNQ